MTGEMKEFSIELYRKTTDGGVLAKGPDDKRFWVKDKVCGVCVQKYTENKLLRHLRTQLYEWLKVQNHSRMRVYKCHFWDSVHRVSLWAFADYNGVCYKCHVEGIKANDELFKNFAN